MELKPTFEIYQILGDCDCFVFEDTTSENEDLGDDDLNAAQTGYGAPNINKSDVSKTEIYVTFADGSKFKVNRPYVPTALPIKICARDLILVEEAETEAEDDCGCGSVAVAEFPEGDMFDPLDTCAEDDNTYAGCLKEGCATIEYVVFSKTKTIELCDYILTDLELQENQTFWVKKNGEFVNVTDDIVDGSWTVEQTEDVYTSYRIMNGEDGQVDKSGYFNSENCISSSEESEDDVENGSCASNHVFHCKTETKLSNAVYKVNIDDNCTNCTSSGLSQEQANNYLALAYAKLDTIKNYNGCNCTCISDNLKQINGLLDTYFSKCQ